MGDQTEVISLFILTKQVKSRKNLRLNWRKKYEASSKQSWEVTLLFSKNNHDLIENMLWEVKYIYIHFESKDFLPKNIYALDAVCKIELI